MSPERRTKSLVSTVVLGHWGQRKHTVNTTWDALPSNGDDLANVLATSSCGAALAFIRCHVVNPNLILALLDSISSWGKYLALPLLNAPLCLPAS